METIIQKSAQGIGITNAVTCVINNINISTENDFLSREIAKVMELISEDRNRIYQIPCYSGFKLLFEKLGYPNQQTACDKLINMFGVKGFKSINNVVDAYNVCSVLFGSPIGVHDATKIPGDVVIRLALGDEEILPMFKLKRKTISKGDLMYESNGKAICWMGKEDLDSDEFKVSNDTKSIFVMAIGNEKTDSAFNKSICTKIYDLLKRQSPDAGYIPVTTILE